jgi:hypothetical protein
MISFFILPKGVLHKLDYYRYRVFWQGDSVKKNISWLSGVWNIDSRIGRVMYSRPPCQEYISPELIDFQATYRRWCLADLPKKKICWLEGVNAGYLKWGLTLLGWPYGHQEAFPPLETFTLKDGS